MNAPPTHPPPTHPPDVTDLGGGVQRIDARLGGRPEVVAVYVHALADGGVALVETASGATVTTVQNALAELGVGPRDVRAIVVTHVHLDHAAGAGRLAAWSGAPVLVHPRGAPHLADPRRLWRSAARLYGAAMDPLFGPMEPVPDAALRPVEPGPLELGGTRFEVLFVPGHAEHHLALLGEDGDAYVGDAAGILLPGVPRIRPALPPPETDLAAAATSCATLAARAPTRLHLTHYATLKGHDAVQAHLAEVPRRNAAWADVVRASLRAGEDAAATVRRLEALEDAELDAVGADPDRRDDDRRASDAAMTAAGLRRALIHHEGFADPQRDAGRGAAGAT